MNNTSLEASNPCKTIGQFEKIRITIMIFRGRNEWDLHIQTKKPSIWSKKVKLLFRINLGIIENEAKHEGHNKANHFDL